MKSLTLVQNFPPDRQESILRFGEILETKLSERIGSDRVYSLSAAPVTTRFFENSKYQKFSSYIDRLLIFNTQLLTTNNNNLYHVLCQPEYVTSLVGKIKILSCHDIIPLLQEKEKLLGGLSSNSLASFLLRWWELAFKVADRIVCGSENTKQDLLRLTNLNPDKLSVVYHGFNREYKPISPDPAKTIITNACPPLANSPFIIHVGQSYAHKNRPGVIEIFNRLAVNFPDLHLVFCGQTFSDIEQLKLSESPFQDRIHQLLDVANEILDALYSQAQFLLLPSLYEGFGLPIIEAMACGCPAIGSNKGSLKEIVLDTDFAPDPNDFDEILAICQRLLLDRDFRQTAIDRGFKHCQKFSTENMVEGYLKVYQMMGLEI